MTRGETIACFKLLTEGAGITVWAPSKLMHSMFAYAKWRPDWSSEYINDNLMVRVRLSEARELIKRAEEQIALEVFEALQ